MCFTWYPLAPSQAFYLFTVFSYHYCFIVIVTVIPTYCRYVRYFLSFPYRTMIPELSVRYPPHKFTSSDFFPTPFQLFSCSVFQPSFCSFCSNRTFHMQTGIHHPMPSGDDLIPISQLLNLALPPRGREDHIFPSLILGSIFYKKLKNVSCEYDRLNG